jgi:hypothetical protein
MQSHTYSPGDALYQYYINGPAKAEQHGYFLKNTANKPTTRMRHFQHWKRNISPTYLEQILKEMQP